MGKLVHLAVAIAVSLVTVAGYLEDPEGRTSLYK